MKKLLIAMMSVASLAFISKAVTLDGTTGTSFESLTIGAELDVERDDAGTTAGKKLWSSTAESVGVVTNANLESYTATCGKPAIATATDEKALMVEAESRLVRSIDVDDTETGDPISFDIGAGIYFDTMVQFTATDTAPTPTTGDKLIVWLYGSGEEDGAFGIGTNLVVTAGYLKTGDEPDPTNYCVTVTGVTVEPNSWHRLTIKAIEKVADTVTAPCGFVVFIDGKEATSAEAKWDADSSLGTPNAVAGVWASKNALFPSLVDSSSRKLSSVALEGTGMIDDISFTSIAPDFARDGNLFTLNWGAGLSALTLNGETVADFTAGEEGSTVILVTTPGTTYTLSATPDSANGWAIAGVTAAGDVAYADNTFTVNGIGTGTIATKQACYTVNGAGAFETFAEALAEAIKSDRATISLTADVTECISVPDAEGKEIILDLAGHSIASVSESGQDPAITVDTGTLIIIDSVGGGTISSDCDDATIYVDSEIILGALEGDKGITVIGLVLFEENATFVRGKFSMFSENDNSVEIIQGALAEGSTITTDENYIIVTPGEGPGPEPETTYELTIPEVTGATAAVTKDGVEVADLTKIAEGTTVVVTWTASEGYKITDGETEEITMNADTEAAEPTVVEITYATLTITQVDNCTIVVKKGEVEVETGATFDVDDEVELTVTRTPEDGYVLDNCEASETITMTENKTVTATVKSATPPEKDYPAYINEADKAKYDAWVEAYGVTDRIDADAALQDAYLLNVAPANAEVEAGKFAILSITVTDGVATVTAPSQNSAGKAFNGTVEIKGKAALTDAEWATVDYTAHHFFKAFLK